VKFFVNQLSNAVFGFLVVILATGGPQVTVILLRNVLVAFRGRRMNELTDENLKSIHLTFS